MADVLKGNFKPKETVSIEETTETVEEAFERKAMQRLGGSICFVSKKKVKWTPSE